MKLTTLLMAVFLTAVSNIAFALDAPEPFEPNDGEVFELNTVVTFSWNKVSGATKYQLVFGTDQSFSGFDEKKNKCTNTKTCATFTVNKISYKLAKTHAFMKKDSSYFWKIRSYKGTTKSAFSDSYQFYVGEPSEETTPSTTKGDVETFKSGDRTFSYTKIANDGSELPKTAKLGTGAKDWACTKDNNTGLIWEVKTDDGGLRDKDNYYSWSDALNFQTDVNKQSLCGAKDWYLPTIQELSGLLVCLDEKYRVYGDDDSTKKFGENTRGAVDCYDPFNATINTTYFPNTPSVLFWSSSLNANNSNLWRVNFGGSAFSYITDYGRVRLTHGKSSSVTFLPSTNTGVSNPPPQPSTSNAYTGILNAKPISSVFPYSVDVTLDGFDTLKTLNFYKVSGSDIFVETEYCYKYGSLKNATLTHKKIDFSDKSSCDVAGVWSRTKQSSGDYAIKITSVTSNWFKVKNTDLYIKTSNCSSALDTAVTLSIESDNTGIITRDASFGTFKAISKCNVTGIYSRL